MKKIGIIIISVLSLILLGIALLFMKLDKQAYVDMNEVYTGFIMTKELDQEFNKVSKKRNAELEALKLELQQMSSTPMNAITEPIFIKKREEFYSNAAKLKEDNQVLNEQYVAKIWSRINVYVKKYGDEEGYDFIYGASGQGNLMYANEHKNITKEILNYINNSYLGAK